MSKATYLKIKYFLVIFAASYFFSLLPTSSHSAIVFQSGWERNPEAGCTAPQGVVDLHLTDQLYHGDPLGWNDDHGMNPCDAPTYSNPSCETVTSEKHSGSRSLVQHLPGYTQIRKTFSSAQTEVYIRYYVKWSSGWRWQPDYDFKCTFVPMAGGHHTYMSTYYNGNSSHGKLRFFWSGVIDNWYSTNVTLNLGTWYCMEWHYVWGNTKDTTYVEARVNGTTVTWTGGITRLHPSATEYNTYMGRWTGFDLDGYCNYTGNSGDMFFDDVEINDGDGWIGCTGDPEPPQAPGGLRIVQ